MCKWFIDIETVTAKDKQIDRQTDKRMNKQRQSDKCSFVKTHNVMYRNKYKIP